MTYLASAGHGPWIQRRASYLSMRIVTQILRRIPNQSPCFSIHFAQGPFCSRSSIITESILHRDSRHVAVVGRLNFLIVEHETSTVPQRLAFSFNAERLTHQLYYLQRCLTVAHYKTRKRYLSSLLFLSTPRGILCVRSSLPSIFSAMRLY
jgi:hypothetical protein